MSMQTLLAMRYNHDRSEERPSKPSIACQARTMVSWTASLASDPPGQHPVAEAGELPTVGVEGRARSGPGSEPDCSVATKGFSNHLMSEAVKLPL